MAEVDYTMIFAHLHKQSNIFLAPRLKELGINVGQFPHLLCVCDKPGIMQDEIAVRTKTDKSTVAKMIRQLVDAGFVTRHENIDDRRSHLVFPTKKALAVYPRIAEEKCVWHASLTATLTEAERQILAMLLAKIVE
jgi:Transcriptional regulators